MKAVEADRELNATSISNDLTLNTSDASVWSLRRYLNDNGFDARLKRPMQSLSDENKKMRFQTAKVYRKWPNRKFMQIFYSDESKINVDGVGWQ